MAHETRDTLAAVIAEMRAERGYLDSIQMRTVKVKQVRMWADRLAALDARGEPEPLLSLQEIQRRLGVGLITAMRVQLAMRDSAPPPSRPAREETP